MHPPSRRDPWILAGTSSAIAFVVLAVLVARNGSGVFLIDAGGAALVAALPIGQPTWEWLTSLGGWILVPIGVGFCVLLLAIGHVRLTVICAVTLLGAALFTDQVKDLIARPRPVEGIEATLGFSYPSGHTLNSTTTYGSIALIAWRSYMTRTIRRVLVIGLVSLPVLVGLSRIGLGVHFTTDVIGGWLAGIAFVAAAAIVIDATDAMTRDVPRRGRQGVSAP